MANNLYINWALKKKPNKEHVTFVNFVKKFGFTNKKSANEAYLSLINSKHIRQKRQKKLHGAYMAFQERSEDSFWTGRALEIADRMLLVNSAIVAKKTGVIVQDAGFREAKSGLRRYPNNTESDFESLEVIDDSDDSTSLEVIDDSDDSVSEVDAGDSASTAGDVTAQEDVDKVLDDDEVLDGNEVLDDKNKSQKVNDLYEVSNLDNQTPEPVLKLRKRSSAKPLSRDRNKKQKSTPPVGHIPAPLDPYSDPAMASRIQRYNNLDPKGFWILSTNRAVETILFTNSLSGNASYKIRSYTIDFSCKLTQALFTAHEWKEMTLLNHFELPKLLPSTEAYIKDVYNALVNGRHAASVPIPEDDQVSCELVLISLIKWSHLYKANPSPFGNDRLSEAFWAREAWPLLKNLLSDVDGITMVDGDNHGYESTKRNGQARRLDQEGQNPRKPGGDKLDLVARDVVNQRDWVVVEAKKKWDELGTDFLLQIGVKLYKQLHLVAGHRLEEVGTVAFMKKARFFAFFSGGRGFKAIELQATEKSSYIKLFHAHPSFVLPSDPGNWKGQLHGLVHLLRIKKCVVETIQLYNQHFRTDIQNEEGYDSDWMYDTKEVVVQDQLLASSPIRPEDDDSD
ncbi:hypothetical protein BGX27_002742 [Mortierella sp. AM989]|nr:hypothetical protein BGX27_002742 [Mortierella sp. AM989]